MKKLIITLAAIFFTSIAFSQIKHNKFTETIDFDKFGSFNFGKTVASEIPNNGGFILSNANQGSLEFQPGFFRLDYQGNVVLDTAYLFTSLSMGGTNIVSSVNSVIVNSENVSLYNTDHTNLYYMPTPYLIKTDTNGNILWHYGYEAGSDSMSVDPEKLIATQDGGYLILGESDNWYNFPDTFATTGFAIKVDGLGMVQWHQQYGNKDTMSVTFNDGMQLDNGDFFFVGNTVNNVFGAKTVDEFSNLITMVRTDNNGTVIWDKGIVLDAPIDQNNGGYGEISCGMFDNNNAFISFSVRDSTVNKNQFAITSVNVNTGNTNWTKVYALPASKEMFIRKAIADGKGNVIVTGEEDGSTGNEIGMVLKINVLGNVIASKNFALPSSNKAPYEIITTADGGFLHISEHSLEEVLIVKTDNDLNSFCPDVENPYLTLTVTNIADSSYINFVDSVTAFPYLDTLQLAFGNAAPNESNDSLICSCSNVITGTITDAQGDPVQGSRVILFKNGAIPAPWSGYDTTLTTPTGAYSFVDVPADSFIVRAEPSFFPPNAMTTYYATPNPTFKWDSAGVFHINCDSSVITKDIQLLNGSALTGNSSLWGYVYEYTGGFNKQPGDPIPGIDITVEQSPGGIVGGSTTNAGGYYELTGLDTNGTYIVSVDYPGLPNDSVYTMVINLSDTIFDSLDFYIDTTGVYIVNNGVATGINIVDANGIKVDLYPNPSSKVFNLKIVAVKAEEITYQLTNEFGQTIIEHKKRIQIGENNIILPTEDISKGIYFLKIQQENKIYIKKLIKL